jgi:hypothetical protein
MCPLNPASLIGHHVVFTAEAVGQVPAFRDTLTIRVVTEYHGVIGGEPQYTVTGNNSDAFDAFLSELRVVGLEGRERAEILHLAHSAS